MFHRLSRNAFARLIKCALLGVGLPLAPCTGARADTQQTCMPVSEPRDAVEARGGTWTTLTPDQWQFARGVYVEIPDTPTRLPPGDNAVLAQLPGADGAILIFIDGDQACSPEPLPASFVALIRAVGRGDIGHADGGL